MTAVEDKGQGLALLRRLAFHVEELRGVGDRLENDDEALGKLQRNDGLLAGGQLERFEHELLHKRLQLFLRQVDAGAPVALTEVPRRGQLVRAEGGDGTHARGDGERAGESGVGNGCVRTGRSRWAPEP